VNAPFLLLGMSAIFAFSLIFLWKNQKIQLAVGTLGTILIALFVMLFPIEDAIDLFGVSMKISSELEVFGRVLKLDNTNRSMIGLLYTISVPQFLGVHGTEIRRRYLTISFLMTASIAAAIMVDPFLYAAIFVEFAVLGGVLMIEYHDRKNEGPLLLASINILAMMAILLSGWTLDVGGVTAGSIELATITKLLLGFGVSVLLCIPPFSVWVLKAARDSKAYEWIYVISLLQFAGTYFLITFLSQYGFFREDPVTQAALRTGGIVFIWIGTVLGAIQNDIDRFVIYAITADLGFMLLVLSGMGSNAFGIVLLASAVRICGMALVAAGLENLKKNKISNENKNLALLLFIVGMLSISGFPMMAGFPARWAILNSALSGDFNAMIAVIASCTVLSLASFRWMYRFIKKSGEISIKININKDWAYILLLLFTLLIGIFPQIINNWIINAIEGLSLLQG